jgi:hypothetical protein
MMPMTSFVKWVVLSFALLLSSLFGSTAEANTITASSCSVSDVQAAINTANNGDTVIIPNGSCTWSSGITFSVQITLQGASTTGVTITDADTNSADSLLLANTGSSFHTTIANLNFLPGTGTGVYVTVHDSPGALVPLMHDVSFNIPNFQLQHAVQWFATGGVIWNANFFSTQNLNGSCGQQIGSDSGSIVVKSYGIPWDSPSTTGTLDANGTLNTYIEDSVFSYVGQAPDVDDSGRIVIRHSQFIGSSGLTHGTTSTYGGRQVEIYNNSFTYPNANRNLNRYFWYRAGTTVVTNNSFQWINGGCYPNKPTLQFVVENAQALADHGCCTGYMCFHQPGSGASLTSHSPSSVGSGNPTQTPGDPFQISDPVYIWNNTGNGQGSSHYSTNEGTTGAPCNNVNPNTGQLYQTSDFYVAGRDYFYDDSSNPNSGAKPGWAPYQYPHPLRNATSGNVPAPPTNLSATVQ